MFCFRLKVLEPAVRLGLALGVGFKVQVKANKNGSTGDGFMACAGLA